MATASPTTLPSASSRRKAAKRPSDSEPTPLLTDNETNPAKKIKLPDDTVKIKKEAEVLAFDWTSEDLTQLIGNLSTCLPKIDNVKYSTLIEKLDWEKVRFGAFSAAECKEKWVQIMTRLRRFRTLTDMVTDAREWLKHPWSSYTNSKKQKHPEMPKKPLTPYFRYFLEKREKYSREHPDMSMTDLAKLLSKKFQLLPEKKKQKYKESYEREIEVYKQELEKFKKEHPEEFPASEPKHHNSIQEGPFKPLTPFQLFQADRSKRPEYVDVDKKVIADRIRKQWTSLSDGKRIKWIRKAVQDEHRYGLELSQYCEGNPNFKADPVKAVLSKAEKELKDRYDGKPDRPPNSGYSMFSKIMLRQLKDVPAKEKMAEISKRWKLLTESERDAYNKQVQKANLKYKEKYAAYMNSLVEEERQKIEGETKTPFLKKAENGGSDKSDKKEPEYRNGMLEEADGLDNRPKKPSSAMFFYQQEKFPVFHQKYPGLSRQELMRLMAREFSELSDKKKEKYRRLAEEERKKAEDNSKPKPKSEGPVEVQSGKKKLFKGEPRKPAQSGYGVFSTEMLSNLTEIDPKNRMAEIAKRWKAMPPPEKDKYKKKAQDLMKKYNKDHHKFLTTLTAEELEEYKTAKLKTAKKPKTAAVKVAVPDKVVKEIKKESESESSDDSDDEEEDGSSSDEEGEESGSESDSDDESDDEKKVNKEDKNESSSADSSDSDSGSGSSDDSDSGSDSEEE